MRFCLSLCVLALVGCGGAQDFDAGTDDDAGAADSGSSVLDAGVTDAGRIDAGVIDAGLLDAGLPDAGGFDAGVADAGSTFTLPSCLGTALPLRFSGQLPYVDATIGSGPTARTGAFLIDFGSTASWVDLTAFTGNPQQSCSNGRCTFADFDYFGSWGQVSLYQSDFSSWVGPPRQAGIIGTDFLSVHPTTLDYRGRRVLSSASAFCTPTELQTAGFVSLSSTGFYASSFSSLRALSTVVTGASSGLTVPNVPTVRIRVGGIEALAQLDTGFDDAVVPHSVNINVPYLNAINAQAPGTLVRASSLDLTLSTCVGVNEPVTAWRLAAGKQLVFVATDGSAVRAEPNAVLFAKNTPAAAQTCGGIGTWSVPAAQISGSYFVGAQTVIFDPLASTVWVPR